MNLKGTVLPSIVFGKSMSERGKGSIVNYSSMTVNQALTRVVGYSAAKAAMENFTRWMAVEMATKFGEGLRVNAIAPGFFIGNEKIGFVELKGAQPFESFKKVIDTQLEN